MTWFLLTLVATILWALVNISDQYLVNKYATGGRSSGALVLFSSLIGVFVAIGIAIFSGNIFDVSMPDKLLLLLAGVLTVLWVILYLYSLEIAEVSNVVPWFLTVPIFGYLFGYLFLGETLNLYQKLGGLIMFVGLIVLSIDFSNSKKFAFKWRVGLYMTISCIFIALMGVIFKYVTVAGDFWVSSFWTNVGLGVSGILLFIFVPKYQRQFMRMLGEGKMKILALNVGSEMFSVIGNFLANYATLLAPVVMVFLVENFQPAILLILTILGTKFFPKIVKEDMSRRVLIPKIISIGIIILGSAILLM